MSYSVKNKILIWAVVILLAANLGTIAAYWLGRVKPAHPVPEQPANYLIRELGFDTIQKLTFLQLVKDHQEQAEKLRHDTKVAKDNLFDLLKQINLADSTKKSAAAAVSSLTQQLDLLTFDHFQKVRNICNEDQKRKFDIIIKDVLKTIGGPGQRGPHGPPGREDGPPGREDGPPPPR